MGSGKGLFAEGRAGRQREQGGEGLQKTGGLAEIFQNEILLKGSEKTGWFGRFMPGSAGWRGRMPQRVVFTGKDMS
ncbi:hypothetical protein [Akkermansia sp.]|uniref:hypothetical protein n=1 Tax=Akkermansia sp. TaxID=1872421 RepID=UPI003994BCB0